MNKKWECRKVDEEKVIKISEEYNISTLLSKILVNKNILESISKEENLGKIKGKINQISIV